MAINLKNEEDFVIIIRCVYERGASQEDALTELGARGLWLSADQKAQAGIAETFEEKRARLIGSYERSAVMWDAIAEKYNGTFAGRRATENAVECRASAERIATDERHCRKVFS